ncbi:MAG: hypothetical protein NTY41_13430 [Proteobacteria bacterium]|nr:hypothetical protein [Pseudomonadota bacterium]
MNRARENLALRKQLLQARSTLCRLRIRHELNTLRDALGWTRSVVTAVTATPVRAAAFGLALYGVSRTPLARALALAVRMLLLGRLAKLALTRWRERASRACPDPDSQA